MNRGIGPPAGEIRQMIWEGEDIRNLSRETLIEIIKELVKERESIYRAHRGDLNVMCGLPRDGES